MEKIAANEFLPTDSLTQVSSASIYNNKLLAFFPGMSAEDKRYIKNSLRWAEHHADLRHDRKRETAQWFDYFSGRLWSVGWSLENAPVEVVDSRYTGSLVDSWAKALSSQVSRTKLQLIKQSFGVLEHDRSAMNLFSERAQQSGDLLFLPAEYNFHKELEMVVTHVQLLSSNWSSRWLFWEFEQPASQLDIRVRRFAAKKREMDTYRERLAEEVKEMRFSELALRL